MVLILLAVTLLYPLMMFAGMPWHLGTLDWGPVWSGYLGCSFFAFAAVAIGMMLSSLTESDVIAFFTTAGALCFLYAIGLMVSLQSWGGFWGTLGDAAAFVSLPDPAAVVHARHHRHPRGRLLPVGDHRLPARRVPLPREPEVVLRNPHGEA